MTWWRRKTPREPELEQRVADAEAQHTEALAQRPETDRLAARMRQHLDDNHFAERLLLAMYETRREP